MVDLNMQFFSDIGSIITVSIILLMVLVIILLIPIILIVVVVKLTRKYKSETKTTQVHSNCYGCPYYQFYLDSQEKK